VSAYTRISLDVSAVPPLPAGAGRYILELARHLGRLNDVRCRVIARKKDALRWESLGGSLEVRAVAPEMRPLRLAWEQTRLPSLLDGVDVHHAPHYTMPERAKLPVVVTVHDMTVFEHPEWHERSKVMLFRRAISVAVQRAGALIAVSNDTATKLREHFPEIDRRDVAVYVVPHGIDHQRFHAAADENETNLLSGLDLPDRYIAFVGTIEPRKNVPDLIRAFDRIASTLPDLHLVIAGQRGWDLHDFDQALAEAAHADRILVPGYVVDAAIPVVLRHAAAVAYPSFAEGFGLPALEALACGAPLVTTTGSAVEEIVGEAAVLVDPGDVDALAQGLEHVLTDDNNDVRRKAGIKVAESYTWDATARAHADIYKQLAVV
jgi:glycosyltransferase involved in cell wall biosynthesis